MPRTTYFPSCNIYKKFQIVYFPGTSILNGDTINNVCKSQHAKDLVDTDSSAYSDSNSCDSGVVADKMLESTPSKRHQKPATPHRIVCPSPVKHAISEKSPSSELSNLNIGTKTHSKSKRR